MMTLKNGSASTARYSEGDDLHVNGRTKSEVFGWRLRDTPGEFKYLPKAALAIDEKYQRALSNKRATQLARDWSWLACGVLIVAKRSDTYFIVDGQHRHAGAMKRSDIQQMPCLIFESEGERREAGAFIESNTARGAMRAAERFKAQVVSGNPAAVTVNKMLEEAGRVASDAANAKSTACLTSLIKYAEKEPAGLARIWPTLVELSNDRVMDSRLLGGLMYLDKCMPEGNKLDRAKWRNRILEIGADRLLASINKAREYYTAGGPKVFARGILNAINYRLQNKLDLPKLSTEG